jgi:hypothetical protein
VDALGKLVDQVDERGGGRAVDPAIGPVVDVVGQAGADALERLGCAGGGGEDDRVGRDTQFRKSLRPRLAGLSAATVERPFNVRQPGFLPARLGVPEQVQSSLAPVSQSGSTSSAAFT